MRTIGPLHFEDLDPHRFEDLVRDLAYDFRDWQTIEAVGRVGADEGFDVRAREKPLYSDDTEDIEEGEEVGTRPSPMDGNVWMIQCKREKELGPKRVEEIINEGMTGMIPYGYILAAPVNFSKKAQDAFRAALRAKGVMEFYLWGKGELEDMLLQPKNDRLLFAFFGISLATRRRSVATTIRAAISSKNRITKALTGDTSSRDFQNPILVRDLHDSTYPFEAKSKDRPDWREYVARDYHPLGLIAHLHKYYAYLDKARKEFDFIDELDLVTRQEDRGGYDEAKERLKRKIEDVWDFLPRDNQAHLVMDGMIAFEDMQIVDDKGDSYYQMPHIFVDFTQNGGPFRWGWENLTMDGMEPEHLSAEYKRIRHFPKRLPEPRKKTLHSDTPIMLDQETSRLLRNAHTYETKHGITFFSVDDRYDFLNVGDGAPISGSTRDDALIAQVTHRYSASVSAYLAKSNRSRSRSEIERQVGREVSDEEVVIVLEVRRAYPWRFDD
ncbi:restriction endonuclease [Armatimonas sp.]|uniref:restriction endonuclease n=1 Tax=Armatimonas sp. TaxID=1872638 RepID=UPI00374D3A9A